MKKRFVLLGMLIIMLALVGCSTEYSEDNKVVTAAWEEDGRVLYVTRYTKYKTTYNPLSQNCVIVADTFYLKRCDSDGNNKEELFPIRGKVLSLSSSGDWVAVSTISDTGGMYVMKLDGSGLQLLGEGLYPDLSPDGSKIVYAKPNQGIWIMNRDGSGDHQIVTDTAASYPAWSPDDSLIAYGEWWTHIVTLNGDSVKLYPQKSFLDWGPKNSNLILIQPYNRLPVILNILTENADTLQFGAYKWSNDGKYIVGSDSGGYYSIKIDGTDKHYIEP